MNAIKNMQSFGRFKQPGVTVYLSNSEAASLAGIVASGKPSDAGGKELRLELLHRIGELALGDPEWHLRLASATENSPTEFEMGIVKLFEQANAIPAIRDYANGLLRQCAKLLGELIDKAGPRAATVIDRARRKGDV
jgi:hypothetical protein